MNRFFLILLVLTILGCNVEFNSDLRDYIDNVSERTPLNLSVENSIDINNEVSFNFGFSSSSKSETIVIKNNELHPVTINSHSGLEGDFLMEALEGVKLEAGETLELDVTYDPGNTPGESVSSYLTLVDRRDREYKLKLYGSSKRQPLDIKVNDEIVESYDFGNYTGIENAVTFELYNDGAVELTIESLELPGNIERIGEGNIALAIGGSMNIKLYYTGDREVTDENITITTDFNQIALVEFIVRAGTYLDIQIDEVDSSNNTLGTVDSDINFDDSGNRSKIFKITNTTDFTMNIYSIIQPDDYYLADFVSTLLEPGDSMNFTLSYEPGLLTPSSTSSQLVIIDLISRRERWINLHTSF